MSPAIKLYADGARGQYIPQHFARTINRETVSGIDPTILDALAIGPDEEGYWDDWATVLDNAVITDFGVAYRLYQDQDLWLIPETMSWDDESEWFK